MTSKTREKPLVGFFPLTYNLAETGRAVLVAKRYMELGGKAIFFSHGGEYEHLIKEFGFDFVRVNPIYTNELVREIVSINRREKRGIPYKESFLRESVKEEIKAFKKTNVKMVISFVNLPCSISARAAGVPLVCVSPAPGTFMIRVPDNFINFSSLFIPKSINLPILNYFFKRSKTFLKSFNAIQKEYNLKPFDRTLDVFHGDVTLGTNFFEFINVFPNQQTLSKENYIGIISLEEVFTDRFSKEEAKAIEYDIKKHLGRSEKSVLLTMGSSGDKNFFLKLIHVLNKTSYNVVVVYANILEKNELPALNPNILLIKSLPSIENLHKMIDLTIMHGGQGTVYSAAYAGKPVIGFPMNSEQHLNLEKMVGHGSGLMLSKKYFKERDFLNAIERIFKDYDTYLKNAQLLAKKLPKPHGDKNAAQRIVEILENYQVKK